LDVQKEEKLIIRKQVLQENRSFLGRWERGLGALLTDLLQIGIIFTLYLKSTT